MDVKFLSAIRSLPSLRGEPELETALSELLTEAAVEPPLTIKGARDKFSTVNRLAKSGRIQVVKGQPGEETVIISVKDLAAIIRAASASLSFTDALSLTGFIPTGPRLVQSEGFEHEDTLLLKSDEDSKQKLGNSQEQQEASSGPSGEQGRDITRSKRPADDHGSHSSRPRLANGWSRFENQ